MYVNDALSNGWLALGHFLYLFSVTHVSCVVGYIYTVSCIVSWLTSTHCPSLVCVFVCIIVQNLCGIDFLFGNIKYIDNT